jgi:Domain of unknown function (DUF5606)
MEYSKLISVVGMPGLFEFVASKTDGAIVRSLDDKQTKFVSNRLHQFTQVVNIEVFTQRENVNLIEVFQAMKASAEVVPSEKDPKAVKAYFEIVYPTMDFDRVYASDMKKMVKWFVQLQAAGISLDIPTEEEVANKEAE